MITMEKTALVRESRLLVRKLFPLILPEFACLYHACALQVLMAKVGQRTMLQAGTAQWPYLRRDEDDGVKPTHFSYFWEGLSSPVNRERLRQNLLPEIHCWIAHRDPDTVIDPTTGTWPTRALIGGYQWTAPLPPDYLWVTLEGLRDLSLSYGYEITYQPSLDACEIASDCAVKAGIYESIMEEVRT